MPKPQKQLEISDTGTVIYDADTNQFWCNLNTWSASIRKAEIYHSDKYVQNVIRKFPDKNLKTASVTITLNRKET